ncbi:MAG: phosphotransferase [Nitriliruptorales bacterium]|nr:phosphotransferase [Nitriliruptorales bacterium]
MPRLPADLQQEAHDRIEAVVDLDPPPPSLVHGDLAGDNVRWRGDAVAGVRDWDLASAWDPAVDAACLAWHD